MCCYCMMADWQFRHNPPWNLKDTPLIPRPLVPGPVIPWDFQKLAEWYDILRRVKEMEDRLGCPCEPNKADYMALIKQRLDTLERVTAEKSKKIVRRRNPGVGIR